MGNQSLDAFWRGSASLSPCAAVEHPCSDFEHRSPGRRPAAWRAPAVRANRRGENAHAGGRAEPCRLRDLGLAEYLGDQSRQAVFHDVPRALELAALAVEVSDTLDPRIYLPMTVADFRAYARACLGNARRVASDLVGAEQAFQDALLLSWSA